MSKRRSPSHVIRPAARPSLVAATVMVLLLAGGAIAQERPAAPAPAPAADGKAATEAAAAAMATNADWPCIQHKQPVLTAPQMWDGPEIAAEGKRSDDSAIAKLVPLLTSRRLPLDDVMKDVKALSDTLPNDQRDAKLTELFQSVLAEINRARASVVNGIEKFQRRQILRSKKLEEDGLKLAELNKSAETDLKNQDAARLAAEAQTRYDWDARVFQERQQNIPIACEIPVLIEARAFAIAQAIRNLMAN